MRLLAALCLCLPLAAQADPVPDPVIERVLDQVAFPATARFAEATATLAADAGKDCSPEALKPDWNAAMDAWLAIEDLRLGPLEEDSRRQAIAFWPDTAGHRTRALARLVAGPPVAVEGFGAQPVSVRGLYALEVLLYDPRFSTYGPQDTACSVVRAAATDLADLAQQVQEGWIPYAETLRTAGEPDNDRFLDASEARQAIFTALLTSMQFDVDERFGLPLGTFDKPRPTRAENRLSGRSLTNLELSLAGHFALVKALVPDPAAAPDSYEDFPRLADRYAALDDPTFDKVSEPGDRFRAEAAQSTLSRLRDSVNVELSKVLGVQMGLNALDGD